MKSRRSTPLLEVRDLHVAYGKAEAVHGATLEVRAGEFVVLLGRNGAGKSTLLHAISGLLPMRSGTIRFGGRDLAGATPRDIVKSGVVQVLEGHRVFHSLSIEDNLLLGTYAGNPRGDRSKLGKVYDMFPELASRRHEMASRLSGGQQQILAVGQGVIGDPKLLILDEPSGGLAPMVIDRILDVASHLRESGVAILLVEQLVEKALRHADYGYLMETGRIVAGGFVHELREGDLLQKVYLGGHA